MRLEDRSITFANSTVLWHTILMENDRSYNTGFLYAATIVALAGGLAALSAVHVGYSRSYIADDRASHDRNALIEDTAWRNDNENARNICLGLLVGDLAAYYVVQLAVAGRTRRENIQDNMVETF